MFTISRARRVAVGLVATAGLVLIPTLTASAHIGVSSPDASPGGEVGKIVFRVPSESESANTTVVTIDLPTDTPFAFVSVGVVPGWTATTETTPLPEPIEIEGFTVTEAVSSVTWTADDDGMAPGEFTEFALAAGPFPENVDELVFPATQTYSDGSVVNWNQPMVEGEEEPENPAPTLTLAAPAAAESGESGEAADDADESESSTDTTARVLAIVGIALGATGIAFGARARRVSKPAA